jgi:DNA-binding winged helix-turn-helix (wHTH) protein
MSHHFGPFELDTARAELRAHGQRVALQPRVFDTLAYLVTHRERVVSRAELLGALWGGLALNRVAVAWSVSHLRKALAQHGGGELIHTVRGRGYRFVGELTRAEEQSAPREPGPQDATLEAYVAALGGSASLALLGALCELPGERLVSRAEAAVHAGQLVWSAEGLALSLACALALDPVTARALHARIAHTLLQRPALRTSDEQLAEHAFRALPLVDPERVAALTRALGERALAASDYARAEHELSRALTALGHGAPAPRTTCELYLALAFARRRAGKVAAARDAMHEARALALAHGYGDLLVEVASQRRPTVWMAAVPDPTTAAIVEQALPLLDPDDPLTQSLAHGLCALLPPRSWQVTESEREAAEALRLAEASGEPSALLAAHRAHFHALSGPRRVAALLEHADTVLRLDTPKRTYWSAEAQLARYLALRHAGQRQAARGALAAFGELGQRLRIAEAGWQWERVVAQERLEAGDAAAAERAFAALFARAQGMFVQHGAFFFAMQQSALHELRTGRPLLAALGSDADEAWAWAAQLSVYRAELARAWADGGRHDDARRELDRLARGGFAEVTEDLTYLYSLVRLAQCALALDGRPHAHALYEALAPFAEFEALNGCWLSLGSVSLTLGALAEGLGERDRARAHLRAALDHASASGQEPFAQRARAGLARL